MKILFWIIVIFFILGYVFRIFLRYGLPWLLGKFIRSQQNKYGDFNSGGFNSQTQNHEGDVRIKTNTKSDHYKNNKDDGFGEYVDFEDVD